MRDLIRDGKRFPVRDHRLYTRGERTQLLRRRDAPCRDVRGTLCELHIPREQRIHGREPLADVLQQGVALTQNMRIAQELPIVCGTCLRELGIQIAAAQCGRPLNEKEILGGKEHHRQDADEVALTQVLTAALDPPPRTACKRKGQRRGNLVAQERQPDMRPAFPHPNKLRIARCAMGAAERGIVQRLDDIRLALCVRPEEDLHPCVKVEGELLVVPVGTQYK